MNKSLLISVVISEPASSAIRNCCHSSHQSRLTSAAAVLAPAACMLGLLVQGKTAGKDLLSDKATYPALLGLEKSKEIAADLIAEAKKALGGYNAKDSAPLIALAEYIGSRTN